MASEHSIPNGSSKVAPPSSLFTDLPDGEWTPDTVLSSLPKDEQPATQTSSPVPFFHVLSRLKTTKREGWRRLGVPDGESISDHMYRMGLITMLAPASLTSKLDISRCTRMALVHDMAESLVGDITPVDGVNKKEKSRREETTMDYLCSTLLGKVDGGVAGDDIKALWREYEDAKTPESIFVHDVDKVELLLQMLEYERAKGGALDLSEFAYVSNKVETPEVKAWCDEILKDQKEFWQKRGRTSDGAAAMEHKSPELKKQVDEYYTH